MTEHHDACRKQGRAGDCQECRLLRDLDIALAERAHNNWRALRDVMAILALASLLCWASS